jgi:diguanylate cyclase
MTLLSVVNSALQSMVIGLYALTGATTWATAGAFTLASLASTGLFAVGVASGWLLFLGDKRLLHAQLLANFAIQMAFMVVEPNLWMIFLGSTLISACYSMVAFTPRQFTWLWLAYGVVTGGAFWLGRHRFGTPPTTGFNLAILWLFYFLGVRRLAMTGAQFSKLREQLSEKNRELTELLARNKVLASHDELTGAFNRRELLQLMGEERDRAVRHGLPFSVAIFDLDHFKAVNDEFGHAGGDAVLKRFCGLVHQAIRSTDRFARYGGEEFVLLMPAGPTAHEDAMAGAERIRQVMMNEDWRAVLGGTAGAVTVSGGIATWRPHETLDALLARADSALYQAKRRGRNNCVMAESLERSAADLACAEG